MIKQITFDFEKNEVTTEQGTMFVKDLDKRYDAILEAADLEEISGAELIKDLNKQLKENGYEGEIGY